MRKKTIKTCLNVIIGFLSMFFLSCQHDEFIEQSKNNDFIFKTITLNEVKSHSDKAATLFTKSTKSSKFNKTSSATEIDSSNVIYLERKNGFKSFTYRLKDDVSLNQFNNIVVYEFPDGSNKVFTVKYLLNKSLLEATKENNLKSSIIGYETSVLKFNNPYQKAASYSCISIGYWVVVDKCEGELVTPENNPGCFNSDGSRATREVFITMEENCSYSSGGSNSGEIYVGGSPTDFLDNGGGGAGLTSFDGIFIPNPYVLGEEDPRNADFNYSMQVSQYLNTITSWKSLLYQANTYGGMSTYWMQPFFVDYFKKNGGLTTENKNKVKSVIDRFNEIYTNENAYKVYENSTERNLINYKLFQTLTNYPTISAKTIQDIFIFRVQNFWSSESLEFTNKTIDFLVTNPTVNLNDILYNRTVLDANASIDIDNNVEGGYDTNSYADFNPQQTWSTISPVIPVSQFVGWRTPGIKKNCMDYAKAQIAKNGYQISNYGSAGQTFQIYTEQNGVNNSNLTKGLSYLKYALSNNIPVIVGVDDDPGHPGNPDNSTDHFVVIVGMGSNSNGNYFQFYDNASGNTSQGTSPLNLLYYNSSTGKISGKSQCSVYFNSVAHDYIITQIRKSKTKP